MMASFCSAVSSKPIKSSAISSRRTCDNGWLGDCLGRKSPEIQQKRASSKHLVGYRNGSDDVASHITASELETLVLDHNQLINEYKSLKDKCKYLQHNEAVLTLYYSYYKKKSAKLKVENTKLVHDWKNTKRQVKHLVSKLEKRKERNEKLHLKLESMKVVNKFSNLCIGHPTNATSDVSDQRGSGSAT